MSEGLSTKTLDRIRARMEKIDRLPPAIRALVHEYGWAPVKELMDLGLTKPSRIEHIIVTCRTGQTPKGRPMPVTGNCSEAADA